MLLLVSGELAHGSTQNPVLRSFYPTNSTDIHQISLKLSRNSSRTKLKRYRNHLGAWKTILLKTSLNFSNLVRTEIIRFWTVAHVWYHNFVVSQRISLIFGALERTGSLLSKTSKIVEIGSEMKRLWLRTYTTVPIWDLRVVGTGVQVEFNEYKLGHKSKTVDIG